MRNFELVVAPCARGVLRAATGEVVAYWVRTRAGAHPLVAHAAWRTTAEVAAEIVLRSIAGVRTPEPLRRARELARVERDRRR